MTRQTVYRRVLSEEIQTRFARLFEATGCRTQVELSEFLNITQSSISDAQRRGNIPADWLLKLLLHHNINPAWVLTGKYNKELYVDSQNLAPIKSLSIEEKTEKSPPITLESFSTEDLMAEVAKRVLLRT